MRKLGPEKVNRIQQEGNRNGVDIAAGILTKLEKRITILPLKINAKNVPRFFLGGRGRDPPAGL
jgi:hypothetical protein